MPNLQTYNSNRLPGVKLLVPRRSARRRRPVLRRAANDDGKPKKNDGMRINEFLYDLTRFLPPSLDV